MFLIWSVESTRTYLLKTRISWYRDFSWWSISSTCRDIACPAHKSFISVNQPFMSLSILQHKDCTCNTCCTGPWMLPLRCNYHTIYLYTSFSLCNKDHALLAKDIKMLAHNHLIHTTSTHWLHYFMTFILWHAWLFLWPNCTTGFESPFYVHLGCG